MNETSKTRNTRQKTLILECLREYGSRHVTADELVERLKAGNTPVPKATVYRNLAQLEKNGLVKRYVISDNAPACYQYIDKAALCHEHFHFMCQGCGRIIHFDDEALRRALTGLKAGRGFEIDGNKTVFYGICADCL